jgi:hypothetical protein
MTAPDTARVAHRVHLGTAETIDVLGPTIEDLTSPDADEAGPCVMPASSRPEASCRCTAIPTPRPS